MFSERVMKIISSYLAGGIEYNSRYSGKIVYQLIQDRCNINKSLKKSLDELKRSPLDSDLHTNFYLHLKNFLTKDMVFSEHLQQLLRIEEPASASSTLIEILRLRAIHQPNQVAYTYLLDGEIEGPSLTYFELDRKARAIGAQLQSLDAAGERVLLIYPPGLEFLIGFFGCLYAGCIAIPTDLPRPNRPNPRLESITADSTPTFLFTTEELMSNFEWPRENTSYLQNLRWLNTNDISEDLAEKWLEPTVSNASLAYLQYTSGSTSMPKGVMVSYNNVLAEIAYIGHGIDIGPESVMVTWLPHFHDMGLVGGLLYPLCDGFPCFVMSPQAFIQKPIRWLEAISRFKGTGSVAPNFAYELCVQKFNPELGTNLDLSSWSQAWNGAEPVYKDTLEKFTKTFEPYGFRLNTFDPVYGLAEATLEVSGRLQYSSKPVFYSVQTEALKKNKIVEASPNQQDSVTLVGCGQVKLDTKVVIVNPDSLVQCSPEEVGEIWISGPIVAQGYWNRPDETKNTFKAYITGRKDGPYLRTGDLGFLKDGELFITGRLKDLIIVRGSNYYPQDIERTIVESHEALRRGRGAAFSITINGMEKLVVVDEVKRVFRKMDLNEVIVAIRQAVSENHELRLYAIVLIKSGHLPMTSSGKIQRSACRTAFLEDRLAVLKSWISKSEQTDDSKKVQDYVVSSLSYESIQELIVDILAKKLHVSHSSIDTQQPFANFGLDSIVSVELIKEVEKRIGNRIELETVAVWNYPTITSLTNHILNELNQKKSISSIDKKPDLSLHRVPKLLPDDTDKRG